MCASHTRTGLHPAGQQSPLASSKTYSGNDLFPECHFRTGRVSSTLEHPLGSRLIVEMSRGLSGNSGWPRGC